MDTAKPSAPAGAWVHSPITFKGIPIASHSYFICGACGEKTVEAATLPHPCCKLSAKALEEHRCNQYSNARPSRRCMGILDYISHGYWQCRICRKWRRI